MSFLFSQTIIIPFLMNVTQTNVMQYRITNPYKYSLYERNAPVAIEEPKLLVKSLSTHLGLETEDETKNPHSILTPDETNVVKSTD